MNTNPVQYYINKNYYTTQDAPQIVCCGSVQYQTYSVETNEPMGCMFCEFDIYA